MEKWKFESARDLGLPFSARLKSLRRESGLLGTVLHILWWTFIRCYLRLYHRLRVHGAEHLPLEAPFILVSNHASHLDVLALAARCPARLRDRLFPIAAGDAFFERVSIAAFAALALNALPLWRKHCDPQDLEELRQRLVGEPCGYVLFPEGTRTRTGQMGRFKRGIGALVASTPVPVIPCYLAGAFEAFPSHFRLPRPRRLTLTVGAPLFFSEVPNDKDGWREVAARIEAEVRRLGGLETFSTLSSPP